ncbi:MULTISPECIES: M15 family metallopeptidase [Chromobacterium]|uniref:M15 family metallopeptidase n=1 Tax=Chromobacterium indicum TaxID=3110228 RepID=A0ABV0CDK2_9NEIS|nr:M15 family metallopeptidase [Chromobacterium violaceum]QRO34115.1 M15 family metallopeptidase [Chromobacterium violaceum]QRQ16082.1 M15 family metallopeptidase [Chromobacterium violaceum]
MSSRDPADLHESIRATALQFLAQANAALKASSSDLEVRFTCTWRPQSEQDALYAQGRTKPGPKVTWVTNSAHNTDLLETPRGDAEAFDVGVFEQGRYLPGANARELALYQRLGPIGEKLGLVWGGRWKSSPDYPHYERANWRTQR